MQNEQLKQAVESENDIKNMIVEYVGEKLLPEDNMVTLEMVVEVLADQFPEFVLAIAEENWVRGYQQGLSDVEDGQKLVENEKQKTCKLCEK
tara:strand:+ start:364 stop:639 length:276 start_codon:yes stop_codon:yes gene_type:complete